jgi:hypothetical protein
MTNAKNGRKPTWRAKNGRKPNMAKPKMEIQKCISERFRSDVETKLSASVTCQIKGFLSNTWQKGDREKKLCSEKYAVSLNGPMK